MLLFSFSLFQSFAPFNGCLFLLICFAVEPPVVSLLLILIFDLRYPLNIHFFKLFSSLSYLVVIGLLHRVHFLLAHLVFKMEALTLLFELLLLSGQAFLHPCFDLLHLALNESLFFFLLCQLIWHAAMAIFMETTCRQLVSALFCIGNGQNLIRLLSA